MKVKNLFEYLKKRWGVDHFWQVILILFIFSITGMSVLYVRKFVFGWLGFTENTPLWEEAATWVIVVFPSYQVLFLLYGFVLGQFEFVWRFEKKTFQRIKGLFVREKPGD